MSGDVETRVPPDVQASGILPVTVRPMTVSLVPAVCSLHLLAAANTPSARLGHRYVVAFMSWFVTAGNTIALVAETEPGHVVGYAIGAPVGYAAALTLHLAWVGATAMIARPWMLFDHRIWATVKARIGFVFSRSAMNTTGLPGPSMSLVGIAVAPSAEGKGVGFALMKAFEERARTLRMASLRLSVYPENSGARRLYERCGWRPLPYPPTPNGTIYYGLILR
jgi:ribosomal protein S18 acetylase RimI-like enzyme